MIAARRWLRTWRHGIHPTRDRIHATFRCMNAIRHGVNLACEDNECDRPWDESRLEDSECDRAWDESRPGDSECDPRWHSCRPAWRVSTLTDSQCDPRSHSCGRPAGAGRRRRRGALQAVENRDPHARHGLALHERSAARHSGATSAPRYPPAALLGLRRLWKIRPLAASRLLLPAAGGRPQRPRRGCPSYFPRSAFNCSIAAS